MLQYRNPLSIAGTATASLWTLPATAQTAPTEQPAPAAPTPAAPTGFWDRANLLGDMGGLRTTLANDGISYGLQSTAEVFANATGGIKQGASRNGLAMLSIGLDTQKAFGWEGGTFNVSALGIYGPNFSQGYLGNLQTASAIVASPTVRLWELWFQPAFLSGRMDVKVGQQSVDQEFITSQGSSLFLIMGWPMLPTADLYAGGPAYPLSSLGVRLRGEPTDSVTMPAGVFQDNPPGGPFNNDSQLLGSTRYGANFNLRTGALFLAELQCALNQPPQGNAKPTSTGLPGTYKIGF
jgi:porin